jgi:prolyl-tRNA synthetase
MSQMPMHIEKSFAKDAKATSHKWMIRGGLLVQNAAGIYTMGPVLTKAHEKLVGLINRELNKTGAVEVNLPVAQPREAWDASGRWEKYQKSGTTFVLQSRHGAEYALSPTAEEMAVQFIQSMVKSPKNLPVTIYQHGPKFRDELRPRGGLLRGREFYMMDAYSFAPDMPNLDKNYAAMREAFINIADALKLKYEIVQADSGDMGGRVSEEFMAMTEAGEDTIIVSDKGAANIEVANQVDLGPNAERRKASEVGHIFKLGSFYSDKMGLSFNMNSIASAVQMGCYGIGTSRMLAAVVEQNHDDKGILWPSSITPFDIHVIQINNSEEVAAAVARIEKNLESNGLDVLIDDRDQRAGGKFKDADILGIPYQLVVGDRVREGMLEVIDRKSGAKHEVSMDDLLARYPLKNVEAERGFNMDFDR